MDLAACNPSCICTQVGEVFQKPEFSKVFMSRISEIYSISALLEIINSCEPGKENEWIQIVDNIFSEIEDSDDMDEYIPEMESLREIFRTNAMMLVNIPCMFHLFLHTFAFILEVLSYVEFEKLSLVSSDPWKSPDDVTSEKSMTLRMFKRTYETVLMGMTSLFCMNLPNMFTGKPLEPVVWSEVSELQKKEYDQGVLRDYTEYLHSRNTFDMKGMKCCVM